jgi:hypothetical protein
MKQSSMKTALAYIGAAVAEIAGCFAFWGWLRLGKPVWWLVPGLFSLIAFAYLLTLVETMLPGGPTPPTAEYMSSPRYCGFGALKACALIGGTLPEPPSA